MWFYFMALEEILATLSYLTKYPTCSKAMGQRSVRHAVKLTWPVEPSFQYGPTPWGGLWFLGNWIGRLTRVQPFSLDKGSCEGRTIPKFRLGFPAAFHRTVLLYYGCQVYEVCYFMATYSIEDSFVCAVFAEK